MIFQFIFYQIFFQLKEVDTCKLIIFLNINWLIEYIEINKRGLVSEKYALKKKMQAVCIETKKYLLLPLLNKRKYNGIQYIYLQVSNTSIHTVYITCYKLKAYVLKYIILCKIIYNNYFIVKFIKTYSLILTWIVGSIY